MDGQFVPNISFGPDLVKALAGTVKLKIDAHLMILEPERFLGRFAEAGAGRIIVHMESCQHICHTIQSIKELGIEAGIALNPGTPLSSLEEVLEIVDLVQIMTVNPGFGGQKFLKSQLRKIRSLRMILGDRGRQMPIAVDGGIHPETAPLVVQAGATILVAGSALFDGLRSVAQNMDKLRSCIPVDSNEPGPCLCSTR